MVKFQLRFSKYTKGLLKFICLVEEKIVKFETLMNLELLEVDLRILSMTLI